MCILGVVWVSSKARHFSTDACSCLPSVQLHGRTCTHCHTRVCANRFTQPFHTIPQVLRRPIKLPDLFSGYRAPRWVVLCKQPQDGLLALYDGLLGHKLHPKTHTTVTIMDVRVNALAASQPASHPPPHTHKAHIHTHTHNYTQVPGGRCAVSCGCARRRASR